MPDAQPPKNTWVDPLLLNKDKSERRVGFFVGFFIALVIYLILFLFLVSIDSEMKNRISKKDNLVEIDIREVTPEPEPEPEPLPEPEPEELEDDKEPEGEEEVPPEPEPKPEPPKPKPRVRPKPKEKPKPEEPPPSQKAPEKAPDNAKEAMDPVNLEGLDKSQFADKSDGPTFKVGTGVETGRVTKTYVDPNRFGKINTSPGGKGLGYGDRDSDGKGTAAPTPGKKCPTRKPRVIKKFRGEYTMAAKRRNIEGVVIGLLTVDKTGHVVDVKIVKPLGSGLDESATRAFRRFLFKPAEKDCQKVASKVRISHSFTIER